jgi:hypothetical protein
MWICLRSSKASVPNHKRVQPDAERPARRVRFGTAAIAQNYSLAKIVFFTIG